MPGETARAGARGARSGARSPTATAISTAPDQVGDRPSPGSAGGTRAAQAERNLSHIGPGLSRPRAAAHPHAMPEPRRAGRCRGRVRRTVGHAFQSSRSRSQPGPPLRRRCRPGALAGASPQATLAARYSPEVRLVAQITPCGGRRAVHADRRRRRARKRPGGAARARGRAANLVKVAPTAADIAGGHTGYHLDFPGDALNPGLRVRAVGAGARSDRRRRRRTRASCPRTARRRSQYWFFYIFNDFNNKHEGDWEMIQLDFPAASAERGAWGRAFRGRLQPARRRRAGRVGRVQAREGRRHAPGRVPGRGLARQLLPAGSVPRRERRGRGRL